MKVRELFDLSGRVALVTGGSRGLGLAMAEALAEIGARVAITARKAKELAEAQAHLAAAGHHVATFIGDLSRPEPTPVLVEAVVSELGTSSAPRTTSRASRCCWRVQRPATSLAKFSRWTAASPPCETNAAR